MTLFLILFSTLSFAGTSRAPAVLDTSCDLDIPVKDIPIIQIHKEQCKRVRVCMGSAADEDMPALKKLEALVCKGELIPVTTHVPKLEVNKAELNDNSRREKKLNKELAPAAPASSAIEK
jgi:hypothetical protein